MPAYRIETFQPKWIPDIVHYWNNAFKDRLNFFSITEDDFKSRVTSKSFGDESFEPAGFFLALKETKICGLLHSGSRREAIARAYNANWTGGTQGYIALLHVAEEERQKGIGGLLLRRAFQHLSKCSGVIIDGQCFNPFYGNSLHPMTPFWGTPEGISIRWKDLGTRQFLDKFGFHPRFNGYTLELSIAKHKLRNKTAKILPAGIVLEKTKNILPKLGGNFSTLQAKIGPDFNTILILRGDSVLAYLIHYNMPEVSPGLSAIWEMNVDPVWQNKGFGGQMLGACIEELKKNMVKRLQTFTAPALSPNAEKFYEGFGFKKMEEWVIY